MKRNSLSIGIPVYNQAATIVQTIESVLAQEEEFDEIVIVDNHSTDGTGAALEMFQGRVRVLRPPQHLGMAANWNYCISNLQSSWFTLLSGDDLLKTSFSRYIKSRIDANPDAALIKTDWEVIDSAGRVQRIHHQFSVALITHEPKNWREQVRGPKTCFGSFAARREFALAVGGFRTDFNLFHDWIFCLDLAMFGTFVRIPVVLLQYRSQERPSLNASRVPLRISDEYNYLMRVLPTLPWRSSCYKRQIRSIRRQRLFDLLNHINEHAYEMDNSEAAILLEIAACAGVDTEYAQWRVNPRRFAPSLIRHFRDKLKASARLIVLHLLHG